MIGSERPKVPSARLSAEPSVVNSSEAEPSVVPTERDLRLTGKIVIVIIGKWKNEVHMISTFLSG